ncbi:tRNA (N(6)-L-threonylcarbamoyladenosine(37)-C(2))-methylthiotransferase MtaB [Clostridium perfringens]|uniref:tRNA (N(6)-L-threonylcarbamoyladenosine(37)-C(2))- methylthiotransferase MtaB n=1 Tax=Clostridium perfringens TaxID=1502 RepID=UPI0013E35C5D|nr:tRNA (N(6)-L-threonylcarbamoyladenosine(37)-C(2))-methylthiotransferase MtaB [Clostridium perfringens]MDK0641294.1 tRNA (N(6)-L-threonylcarbamoyladenosine(37)-C(2))-methylthiotransferase MtaB [Clostridium perfringens]MDM0765610.1 tRNA (N(6)-L-threonylcarbamoyladenosine(37)-C(2))-methylthiotransferase MtaB [Clostridium perfringens]NGT37979.1 tRNA (N(6)-L-threonylcarbamoyladenosine(37)-C(2))-methylthiotransferase MtaB [Clostridium perfringens]
MKVAFATLGCRVNTYESEAMTEKFVREGYEVVDFNEMADVYVVNTCSVTNMGDKKSRQIIGRARRQNPEAIIAVVGCYAQIAPTEVSGIEGVDVVLGSRNKGEIVYYVNKARDEGKQQVKVGAVLKNKVFEDLKIEEYNNKTRAFLKIQDGCNRFCAYCLIPYTRGSVCSKDPKKVLEEIRSLADHGFKEIILSGIHTASYGVDLDEKVTLVDLLEEIEKIDGIERVRIGSIDPTFFTEDVVRRILALKKLCPHFHLSLQSGCDATLKRMNRRYTAKEYEDIVNLLRDKIEDVSITTDVIVGFPGETDEEFEETYEFLKRIALSKTHIFKYSPRKGTRAENMENQVDGNKKDERSKKLIELNRINEKAFAEKYIGEVIDVLFEEEVELGSGVYTGYTRNYIKVNAKTDCNVSGKILNVKINSFEGEVAEGEIVL